jgi:LysR family transcriptional regulator for metE and metH
MIQMVACGRGVSALPRWLIKEYSEKYDIVPVKLGKKGIHKRIHLGIREGDESIDYIQAPSKHLGWLRAI